MIVLIFVISAMLIQTTPQQTKPGTNTADATAYQNNLLSQVDSEDGAPRSGRDPASQQQTSLASVASKPTGAGQRVDKPAADVSGNQDRKNTYSDVYGGLNQIGISFNGCYIDYGILGEQCVPTHVSSNGTLTCDGVHMDFPGGVKVTGSDRYKLDVNQDGVACGVGD